MWVEQEYRNKKLGSTLLSQLITYAKKQECKFIQLDTAEFQARNFYEKHGFVVIATLPQGFMGYDQYIMRRTL